jgi:peptidoglycan-associated lipoprotein
MCALVACSTTEEVTSDAEETATETSQMGTTAEGAIGTGVAEEMLTPEQEREQRFIELRREHIVYFDFDKSVVRDEFAEMLQAHAAYLRDNSNVKLLIEGHADERGTPEYNIALGERRAKAVSKYLVGLGVLESQISIVSYGEEKPIDFSHSEEAWEKNRRAVLVY